MSGYVIQKRESCPGCNGTGRKDVRADNITGQVATDKTCSMCVDGSIYTEFDLAVELGDFGLIARGGTGKSVAQCDNATASARSS